MNAYETLKSEAQAAAEANSKWHSGNATATVRGINLVLYVAQQQRSNKLSRRPAFVCTHYVDNKKVSKAEFLQHLA